MRSPKRVTRLVIAAGFLAGAAAVAETATSSAGRHSKPAAAVTTVAPSSTPAVLVGIGIPRITSVAISGTITAPVITIHGQRLGARPGRNPSYAPAGHGGCAVIAPTGNLARFGYDYGTAVYLHDSSSSPVWGAGRYRAGTGELDCVGVIITKFTSSTIVLSLGVAYPSYPGVRAKYNLKPGDSYSVHVNGLTFAGHIRYR